MSDTLKLALRISAVDLFSGVLRRFRNEVAGTGAEAQAMQKRYDQMINHTQAGLKSLAVSGYLIEKIKGAKEQSADLQESLLSVKAILQGANPQATKLADEMDRVRRNSIEVASHMRFSATAVTDVTRELIQSGVPLQAILERTNKQGKVVGHGAAYMVEALAETKNMDPATVARNIANIGHSFQLGPNQYGQIANIIAKASVLGSGTMDQLFHSIDQAGASAHLFGGMDLKSVAIATKALAPYGEAAGTYFGDFLKHLTGGSYRGRKWMAESGLKFYDKHGQFIGLDASLREIQAKYAHATPERRNKDLGLLFGQQGGYALAMLLAPSRPGVKSYWEMEKSYDKQASLTQQRDVWAQGLNANVEMLQSTNKSTLASLFDPLLKPLTALTKAMNNLSGKVGDAAENHRWIADSASGAAVAGVAVSGGYGIYRLIRAAQAGSPLLKGFLRGTGTTAVGVAEGKAIEKLTGVTPVFVTNWPGTGMPFGAGSALSSAEKEATAEAESTAAAAAASRAEASARAESAMMTAGSVAEKAGMAMKFGGALKFLSFLDAAAFVPIPNMDARDRQWMKSQEDYMQHHSWWDRWKSVFEAKTWHNAFHHSGSAPDSAKLEGTIRIQLDQQGRAKVIQAKTNQRDVHLDVGTMLGTP